MRTVNVFECDYELYELAVREGWYDGEPEEFDALAMFEGDPDMIKINNDTGYFFYHYDTDTIYYWFDECFSGFNISAILIRFYEHRLRKEYYDGVQSWNWFDSHDGIAYRGGMGYVYTIYPLHFGNRYAA